MTIQLLYYLKLYGTDKTTIINQIQFFVSGDSFKDIMDYADRFVTDYIQYIRKKRKISQNLNMVQMEV